MIFKWSQGSIGTSNGSSSAVNQGSSLNISILLEASNRLAALLPLYAESQSLRPGTRLASTSVVRAQVRHCIAALSGANNSDLTALRTRLSQAVRSIHDAPNETTARALYRAPQVQKALWAWAGAEASLFVKNLTRNAPIDDDKQADLASDAVMGFLREESKREGQGKLNPFLMARTWDQSRMADPLGTLRKYLHAWVKNVVQQHNQQQIHEGISLDAPAVGVGSDSGYSLGEVIEGKQNANPEAVLLNRADHRSQVATMTTMYQRQVAGLESDIRAFEGRTDAYSVAQKAVLSNRLDAIKEMVAPLLQKLQQTAVSVSATEAERSLNPDERERRLTNLNRQFEDEMRDLTAISEAQERAHGKRITREEASIQALQQKQNDPSPQAYSDGETGPVAGPQAQESAFNTKKPLSDPLTTARAYARAQENAERLLPHVYRSLTHRKNSDLSQKYTAGLMTNWKLLDGISSQSDLTTVLSPDASVRATANDRALFSGTALRVMMILRDLYTYDEKYNAIRGDGEKVPKSAKERFIQLLGQEIERDPVLHSRAPQLLDLLKEFVTGNSFRTIWEHTDYIARTGAYERARNEKVDKRWSDLSTDDINTVADEAGSLLYDNQHRPFAAWNQADAQQRVTRDLRLTPEERREIMRKEVGRITGMMRGDVPRGTWAHGEPVEGGRFHDKPRATQQVPSAAEIGDPTIFTAALLIRPRRFASKYVPIAF